jgi:hypothetical protein
MQNEERPIRHTTSNSVEYLPEEEVIRRVDYIIQNMRGMLVALS